MAATKLPRWTRSCPRTGGALRAEAARYRESPPRSTKFANTKFAKFAGDCRARPSRMLREMPAVA